MTLFRDIEAYREAAPRSVVAIGNFDGVHAGHRHVLMQVSRLADEAGVASGVVTFDPHPVKFFRPQTPEFRLTTLEERAALLGDAGITHLLALTFDAHLASLGAAEFVDLLVDGLGVSQVLVGEGFRFGKGRSGDTEILTSLCAARDVAVHVVPLKAVDGVVVSSTQIRAAIAEADFAGVRRLMGRNFMVSGVVVHGDARGREMGFPTANVAVARRVLPPDGIYATWLYDGDARHAAATYVGTRPTFEGQDRRVESFVIGAQGPVDLYGHEVVVEFVGHVRGDQKFDSAEALMAQMEADVVRAQELLGM